MFALDRGAERAVHVRTAAHVLTLFPAMGPMLESITHDVEAARERVWVETYIYRDGRLGRSFGERLVTAARRGADVRLLYDPLGSEEADPRYFDELAARGVKVRAYRPRPVMWRTGSYWPRDHSRVVSVDDKAYTGGAAWGDEWLPRDEGGDGWHDVCSRVHGPCSEDFGRVFLQRWAEAAGELAPEDYATHHRYPDLEFVSDSPVAGDMLVYERYRERVRRARKRVWIENAYFLPPLGLLRDLYDAAARGVDVRVVVPARSDLAIIARAARAEHDQWLAHGIKVFQFVPTMLHSKFAVVDDDWATIGTFNANVTSIRYANEANLFVFDRTFVAAVARLFGADVARSRRLTPALLGRRSPADWLKDALANAVFNLLEIGSGSTAPLAPPPALAPAR